MKKIISFTLIFLLVTFPVLANKSPKAFRDINFKDSRKTVIDKVHNDDQINVSDDFLYSFEIADVNYEIRFDYYNSELYRVKIYGNNYTVDKLEEAKRERSILVQSISERYGPPSDKKDVEFYGLKNGNITITHIWRDKDIEEDKEIVSGIGMDSFMVYPALVIEYPPLVEAKNKKEKEEKQQEIEEKSNSF